MKTRAKHKQFNFPYLYDGDTEVVSRAFGPVATPHAFVFDKERRLRYAGRVDDSERPEFVKTRDLRNAIDALLAGRDVEVKLLRSLALGGKRSVEIQLLLDSQIDAKADYLLAVKGTGSR